MNRPVCVRVRLKTGVLSRVREWAAYLAAHRSEALQTLEAEGVSIESVFLDSTADGDFLIYYMRSASHEKAREVAARSTAAIDNFHKAFKREAWVDVRQLELLVDLHFDGS